MQSLRQSAPHSPSDFDFEIGDWSVQHRRRKDLLNTSDEWIEFDGFSSTRKILGGFGNLEENLLHFPGQSYRAIALRSYHAETQTWSIWWLDGRNPHALDSPVIGRFAKGIGLFCADEVFLGVPTRVRFIWDTTDPGQPCWEQAFSQDSGETWDTNWHMTFTKKSRI